MSKRASYKEDFEAIYLRHDYLRKVDTFDSKWIQKHQGVIKVTANKMFEKLSPNFDLVGFDLDDIISITGAYTLSFMGLYSFETNQELKDRFIDKYFKRNGRNPSEEELERIDRNNLIDFLRQKIQYCSAICERKSRNIKVGRERNGIFAETSNSKKSTDELIMDNYKEFGYRKVSAKEFEECKTNAKESGSMEIKDKNGFKIFKIQILSSGITSEDYAFVVENFYDNIYNNTPEDMFIAYEDDKLLESFKKTFESFTVSQKISKIKDFMNKNIRNPKLKKELSTARKLLKQLREDKKQNNNKVMV